MYAEIEYLSMILRDNVTIMQSQMDKGCNIFGKVWFEDAELKWLQKIPNTGQAMQTDTQFIPAWKTGTTFCEGT